MNDRQNFTIKKWLQHIAASIAMLLFLLSANAQNKKPFKVIAFYTGKNDKAHVSFVHEANKWFPKMASKYNFTYDSTSNWSNLNLEFLSKYQVVLFLDTRAEDPDQRIAFERYMKRGGAWMGFHFSAFALKDSAYPDNWDWYHNEFLGSGGYGSNTWRPTAAVLRVEDPKHPVVRNIPHTFKSAPNEWYRWTNDLRKNPDIKILLSIDTSSFPLGTGPKAYEIWHEGYYPVVWTNTKYKMVYVNMGHNDMDYDHAPYNKELSLSFDNETQNQMLINSIIWLGTSKRLPLK